MQLEQSDIHSWRERERELPKDIFRLARDTNGASSECDDSGGNYRCVLNGQIKRERWKRGERETKSKNVGAVLNVAAIYGDLTSPLPTVSVTLAIYDSAPLSISR